MTIDRRLHHAARELRELPVAPPEPPPPPGKMGLAARTLAMATPAVVFVVGLLGAATVLQVDPSVDPGGDTAAVAAGNPPARVIGPDHVESAPADDDRHVAAATWSPAPTAVEEVALIASLGSDVPSAPRPATTTPPTNVA